jgi:hypothetical protein
MAGTSRKDIKGERYSLPAFSNFKSQQTMASITIRFKFSHQISAVPTDIFWTTTALYTFQIESISFSNSNCTLELIADFST